jgi:hypothetical protein
MWAPGADRLTAGQAGQGPVAKAAPKYVNKNLEWKGFTLKNRSF